MIASSLSFLTLIQSQRLPFLINFNDEMCRDVMKPGTRKV